VIYDEAVEQLRRELESVENELNCAIAVQQEAAEEKTSRQVLRSIQTALKEALLALPEEEYDWFELRKRVDAKRTPRPDEDHEDQALHETAPGLPATSEHAQPADQMQFFEHPGPLFSVRISPASAVVAVGQSRSLHAVPRDRSRRRIDDGVVFLWQILEGEGTIEPADGEIVQFRAAAEPGLIRLQLTASQASVTCQAESLITVTDTLLPPPAREGATHPGIPGYTFEKAAGELWRSRYDDARNLIVINNGHRDFIFASRNKALKLRYLCRLFAKELILRNFVGIPHDQVLERMIELTLYTEEYLK
jgi:hypothetical protein